MELKNLYDKEITVEFVTLLTVAIWEGAWRAGYTPGNPAVKEPVPNRCGHPQATSSGDTQTWASVGPGS